MGRVVRQRATPGKWPRAARQPVSTDGGGGRYHGAMPLHDWDVVTGWGGVHLLWMTELLREVKRELPPGYRAYLGAVPALAVGAPATKPDVSVRSALPERPPPVELPERADEMEPDIEVAVATVERNTALVVEREGSLIAAVELISPRNKDRASARESFVTRAAAYLHSSVHLLVVDVHRRPIGFSIADAIACELSIEEPPVPAPLAVSYRVGEPAATGGRMVSIWHRSLSPGAPLPRLPLPLTADRSITVDLESTYVAAARDAYLE